MNPVLETKPAKMLHFLTVGAALPHYLSSTWRTRLKHQKVRQPW